VLHRSINSAPDSLDPHAYSGSDAATILYDIGEGLLTLDSNAEVKGGLAHKWEVSADGRHLSFHLRRDLKWSNGLPLNAQDVVRSFRRMVEPATASPNSHNALKIKNAAEILSGRLSSNQLGVTAPDAQTINIELEQPTTYFLQLLAHPSMQPRYDQKNPSSRAFLPISTGAYKVVDAVIGSSFHLAKNEHYWGSEDVEIGEVVYHVIDQQIEPIRFLAGEIDITDNVSEQYFDKFKTSQSQTLRIAPMLGVYYIGFNLKSGQFVEQLKLRRAFALAINREELVEKVLRRGELPAFRFVPPGLEGYPLVQTELTETQAEKEKLAKELFRDADISDLRTEEIELRYNTGGGHERIATAIASMWREVLGVQVRLRAEEFKVFLENVRSGTDTELFRLSWTGDYSDPYTFLQIFESESSSNLTGFSSGEFDSLMQQANATSDPEIRLELLAAAEELILQQAPVIPIYFYVSKHLVSERVSGWDPNILDVHKSQYMSLLD
jgi:oligopeptide transport system substrate-binding protein